MMYKFLVFCVVAVVSVLSFIISTVLFGPILLALVGVAFSWLVGSMTKEAMLRKGD